MISVRNLVKYFGNRKAVDDISFEVGQGVVLGFLGPNGAGKTTTMRMLTTFLPPNSGTAVINGHDILAAPVEARKSIGYLPENAPLYTDMTVDGFLGFAAEMRGFTGRERDDKVNLAIDKFLLAGVRRQSIDTLSKGYRQRTCFAQALLHDPPILIMDEPTEGLDPNQKHVVRQMIREMGKQKAIILSTHVLEEVESICTRVLIINDGKLVADSAPETLKKKSKFYNVVTVQLVAPHDESEKALLSIGDVKNVETVVEGDEQQTFRVYPKNGQPVAPLVLDLAHQRDWLITDVQVDDGRLDDVFRRLTTTEDTR